MKLPLKMRVSKEWLKEQILQDPDNEEVGVGAYMTTPNTPTPELERLEVTESYLRAYGSIENAIAVHKAIETITEQAAAIAKLTAERDAVLSNIPMDYLQRHDLVGATGPTPTLNLGAAMREYAEDRWKAIERITSLTTANKLLSERVSVLDAMLRELKAATGHDDGLIAIRHLVLRATQAEDYITAREAK